MNSSRRCLSNSICVPLMCLAASFIAVAAGCNQPGTSASWMRNGLLDPSQSGNFEKPVRLEIRDGVSILDEPIGIQDADEPTEDDLVVNYEEPRIGPGDFLKITIFELMAPNLTTEQQFQVKTTGYETLPVLGPTSVAGMTSRELELAIKAKLRDTGILENADVQVTVLRYESQQYSIVGGVVQPGNFPLPRPNFRLLNAMAASGGVPAQAETVIVIRNGAKQFINNPAEPAGQPELPTSPESPFQTPDGGNITFSMTDVSSQGVAGATSAPSSAPSGARNGVNELEILEGGPPKSGDNVTPVYNPETGEWELKSKSAETAPATSADADMNGHANPIDDSAPLETTSASMPTTTSPESAAPGAENMEDMESGVRVIEIPAKALREGDPRYNIVIRPADLIDVPVGDIGEFYMHGNIARPGAYQLTGRRITVKQAIAAAGGFGPLAWPSRADLIRRVGKDEEQFIQIDLDAIFAGTAPDFYLRPNDVVNIGSSPVSVFLAVIRNAFRFSYGFGFVYDRNFGDSDSFQAREQVKDRRRLEAQQRGLPF